MYGNSPKLEHDDEGKVRVKSTENPAPEGKEMDKDLPVHVKHVMERHSMYARHAHEHAMYDAAGKKDKEEMHSRHEQEMKEMHSRHEKELKGNK